MRRPRIRTRIPTHSPSAPPFLPLGSPLRLALPVALLTFLAVAPPPAKGQIGIPGTIGNISNAPGVLIDTEGHVRYRETDEREELAAMRTRARNAADAAKQESLACVSLPDAFARAKAAVDAGNEIPEEVRYLGGITQLRFVFVYPEANDLVIAGPAEPWVVDGINVTGKRSGRPVLHLEDLVVTMRTAREGGGRLFGCGLYPDPNSLKAAEDIARRMARRSRKERAAALTAAMGPQEVRVFGTAADTRVALVCIAADYKLKRLALGLDAIPTAPVGHAVDNSRSAANKFWFEASYESLLVSADGNAFHVRGQRLAVKAGMFDFDPRGATQTAKAFTERFTKQLPHVAVAVPLVAELQNVADLSLLANLIRVDRLDQKVGWDTSWIFERGGARKGGGAGDGSGGAGGGFPLTPSPTPKTAETLVNFTSGSMVAGGVVLSVDRWVPPAEREKDARGALDGPRREAARLRRAGMKGEQTTPEGNGTRSGGAPRTR